MGTEADAAAGGGNSTALLTTTSKNPPLSKRQRRKHVNPSNTWPQQPKIQTPAARAKANLRVAGLLLPGKSSTTRLDPKLDLHSPQVKFGRILGAPEQRKRHLAVVSLQTYLKQRCDIHSSHGISELDLLKLWKALWYTLYLADKVPVQEELSKRLAKLLWCVAGTEEEDEYAAQMYLDMCNQQEDDDVVMEEIVNTINGEVGSEEDASSSNDDDEEQDSSDESSEPDDHPDKEHQLQDYQNEDIPDELIQHCRGAHLAALFVKTFFRTIQREWGKMDKHRIDKFYTLVRLELHEIFSYMAARHWNRGIIFLFNDVIRDEVLFQVPNGLRCHLIDICISELAKVNTKAPMPLTEATLLDVLDPYFALAQNCDDSMVHGRVMENVFAKFLDEYSIVSQEQDSEQVMDQVHVGTIAKFLFELGSDVDTQERYRKPLYDMHKTYVKRVKKVGRDVDLELEVDSSDDIEDGDMMGLVEEQLEEEDVGATKRKRKAKQLVEEDGDDAIGAIASEEVAHSQKKKQKKNKKRKDVEDANPSVADQGPLQETTESDVPPTEPKKSKKRKKKKRKSSISSDEGSLGSRGDVQEEVITISYSDQKKAANGIAKQDKVGRKKTKATKTPHNSPKTPEQTSEEKRVKFGRMNQSKSYNASMKALKTVKHTPNKTPDHGILRTKIGSSSSSRSSSSSQKKGRKKATDYF